MTENQVFAMGRNQPYGHQHYAANDWMAGQEDADRLDIFIDTTHDERLPKSPMLGENLIEAVEEAYETEYETDYEVNVYERDVLDPGFYTDLVSRTVDGYTFITGEQSHADALSSVFPGFSVFGYEVSHWPREADRFEDYDDLHIVSSSTEIRQMIREDDQEWRDAVSDPVEEAIDAEYEAIKDAIVPGEEYDGSKYKDIIASNGAPWSWAVTAHDLYEDYVSEE